MNLFLDEYAAAGTAALALIEIQSEMRTGDFTKLKDARGRLISIYDPNTGQPISLPPTEPLDMSSVIIRFNLPLRNCTAPTEAGRFDLLPNFVAYATKFGSPDERVFAIFGLSSGAQSL